MRNSLKTKVILRQMLIITATVVILSTPAFFLTNSILVNEEYKLLDARSAFLANDVYFRTNEISRRITAIADDQAIEAYALKKNTEIPIRMFKRERGSFHLLSFHNSQGLEEVTIRMGRAEELGYEAKEVKNALKEPGKVVWSIPAPRQGSKAAIRLAYAKTNFFDAILGVILGEHPLSGITDEVNRNFDNDKGFSLMLDSAGNIISRSITADGFEKFRLEGNEAASIEADILSGRAVSGRAGFMGEDSLIVSKPVEKYGWSIVSIVPYGHVRELITPVFRIIASFAIVVLALVSILTYHQAVKFTAPILEMSEAAAAVARGDLSRKVSVEEKDEIGILAASFNSMTNDLAIGREKLLKVMSAAESASRAKSEFLSVMSHEVRTPLNQIMGAVQLLQLGKLDESQTECVKMAWEASNEFMTMLNNVLEYVRLEEGKVKDFILIDPREMIAAKFAKLTARAEAKGLHYEWRIHGNVPETIYGEEKKVRQLLTCLLDNAIKFTETGSCFLEVTALPVNRVDEIRLLFTISDTGCGIGDESLNLIFEPFTQAEDSMTRSHGGIGLGLTMAKRLLKLLNATICIDSEIDEGTSVYVSIPFVPASCPPE